MAHPKKYFQAFRDWLGLVGVDLLLMVCLSLATLVLKLDHEIFRQSKRLFPMWYTESQGWYGPTDLSHPKQPLILGNTIAGLIFTAVPIVVILTMQVFVRSFWDANAALLGLLKGLVIMYVPTVFTLLLPNLRKQCQNSRHCQSTTYISMSRSNWLNSH